MYSSSSSKEEGSLSSHEKYYFGPNRLLTKRIRVKSHDGTLDFTITGGNGIQPIQIASVVWASPAYLQGMRPGDQIISVSNISFQQDINYTKALQVCLLCIFCLSTFQSLLLNTERIIFANIFGVSFCFAWIDLVNNLDSFYRIET